MRPLLIISVFLVFMLAMDFYALRGIQYILPDGMSLKPLLLYIYWGGTCLMFLALLLAGMRFQQMRDPSRFFGISVIMGIFLMLYLPKLLFNASQVLGDLATWITVWITGDPGKLRSYFLFPGLVLAVFIFFAFGLGMIRGRTNIKVFRETVSLPGLPAAFRDFRIVQLSDIHLAGFYRNPEYIARVVRQVNSLEPDLLLFTGDLVHNFSEEADPFTDILNELHAPMGKFAVLGNHDYGLYFSWKSPEEEAANLERVKDQIRACGFDLLLNEHRSISLNGDSLDIIGVENWGKPPFPQHGDLEKALEGSRPGRIRILLSHDPSHWDLRVHGREDIALTLSGHTHGMQMGIEWGQFRWSPSRWTYKHWAGLYRENGQYLYVNRGLGFTGFPGRVGIRPEITLLTLETE